MSTGLPHLLVAGVGPLPPERPDRLFAPGLRIWGMARELALAGHPIRLVCGRFGQGERASARRYDLFWDRGEAPGLPAPTVIELPAGGWPALLAAEAREFSPAAAIGSSDVMNCALAEAGLKMPIWMDYFGDPMAERQMLALRHGSDDGLVDQWNLVAPALARADRVSGCSVDQCAALLGQLGAVGRLNRFTVHERLVARLAPWVETIPIDIDAPSPLRGTLVPEDAYIIVQTGGFNTWLDVQTLFDVLERVMGVNARIHFAATGGAIPGHHVGAYEWFAAQVEKSQYRSRYHLLGWVPLGQVPRVIAEGDVGLNIDLQCPEGVLGTRNRLLDWVAGGLTVISTPGCELAREIGDEGLITLVPHGDAEEIARTILTLVAKSPRTRKATAQAAGERVREDYAPERSLAPLLKWAATPKPASDLQAWRSGDEDPPALLTQMLDTAAAVREARHAAQRLAWLERRLATMEGSRLVRWAMKWRRRKGLEPEKANEEL